MDDGEGMRMKRGRMWEGIGWRDDNMMDQLFHLMVLGGGGGRVTRLDISNVGRNADVKWNSCRTQPYHSDLAYSTTLAYPLQLENYIAILQ